MSKKSSKRTGIVSKTRSNETRLEALEKFFRLVTVVVELLTAIVLYLSA